MKKLKIGVALLLLLMLLVSCGNKQEADVPEEPAEPAAEQVSVEEAEEEEVANEVESPAEDNRIISLSPPIYSMLCAMDMENQVVGANPRTFNSANPVILEAINPDYKNINTEFVNADFKVNKESLLSLDPTIVLLYGKFQDEGLSELQIPVENLKIDTMIPEEIITYWEGALAEIFGTENQGKFAKAWAETNAIIEEHQENRNIKGLYIFSNMKTLSVSGQDSYGDTYMKMVGIDNVAGEVAGFKEGAGQAEVSMEQIHEWNPDIIFVGVGASAQDMIDGNIPNQNWENINAVKNGKVYDIPNGVYNWGMPCAESPLMPLWMLSTVDEDALSRADLDAHIKAYYQEIFGVELDDALLDSIYHHR